MSGEVPFASADLKAALDFIKQFIREKTPPGAIDSACLELVGRPDEEIEQAVQRVVLEAHDILKLRTTISEAAKTALPFVAGYVLRERVRELGKVGRA